MNGIVVRFKSLFAMSSDEADSQCGQQERFHIFDGDEIVDRPPMEWHVKKLLPKRGLAIVFGSSGVAKTFFTLDIMLAVCLGQSWCGLAVKKARVVYVTAEGLDGVSQRLKAMRIAKEVSVKSLGLIVDCPNLLDGDEMLLSSQIEKRGGADIIVFDTLAQSMLGGDENSSRDMGKMLAACRRLQESTGALILFVHHSGKDAGKGERGWSGVRATADVSIRITRNLSYHIAEVSKSKDGPDGAKFFFNLREVKLGCDGDGDPISSCVLDYLDPAIHAQAAKRGSTWKERNLSALSELRCNGNSAPSREEIVALAVSHAPTPIGKEDRRREVARRALDSLIKIGEIPWLAIKNKS